MKTVKAMKKFEIFGLLFTTGSAYRAHEREWSDRIVTYNKYIDEQQERIQKLETTNRDINKQREKIADKLVEANVKLSA